MKKKILSLCLVVCLLAVAVVGGTLAYFTDTDKDVNVMTAGNVQIVQNETDRHGRAWQDDNTAELLPAVYLKDLNGDGTYETPYKPATIAEGPGGYGPEYDGNGQEMWYTGTMDDTDGDGTLKIYDDNINNEIDKVISVTNKGSLPAYVRTLILIENDADNKICEKVHVLWGKDFVGQWVIDAPDVLDIGGTTYSVYVCTYNAALEAGKTSSPSLMQLFLDPSADNAWYDLLGDGELSIIALSQAAQTTGFTSPAEALNTAFGEVTAANVTKWVNETNIDTNGNLNVIG